MIDNDSFFGAEAVSEDVLNLPTMTEDEEISFLRGLNALTDMLRNGKDPEKAFDRGIPFSIDDENKHFRKVLPHRYVKPPPPNVMDWLERSSYGSFNGGDGHRELFVYELWNLVTYVSGFIPVGSGSYLDIIKSEKYVAGRLLMSYITREAQAVSKKYNDTSMGISKFSTLLWKAYALLKSIEVADTPCWHSLSEGLTYSLMTTKLKGVLADEIRLPYPTTLIELPKDVIRVVYRDTDRVDTCRLMVVTKSEATLDEGGEPEETLLVNLMLVPTAGIKMGDSLGTVLTPWLSFGLSKGKEIIDCLKDSARRNNKGLLTDRAYALVGDGKMGFNELNERIGRLVYNSLIYFTTPQADLKMFKHKDPSNKKKGKKKKLTKKQRKAAAARKFTLWEECAVGTTVPLNSDIKNAAGMPGGKGGWTVSYSHVVPGHWKSQPYGPKRSLRKRIFIEPYVRGRNLHERIMGHTHKDSSPPT